MMNTRILLFFSVFLVASINGRISINTVTNNFIDENNRTIIYHGINIATPTAPHIPSTEDEFDPIHSMSSIDFERLVEWGIKFIRVPLYWELMEPSNGTYNDTYLGEIQKFIKKANVYGLQVILHGHQDLLCRKFCGVGFPNWAFTNLTFPEPFGREMFYENDGSAQKPYCSQLTLRKLYYSDDVVRSFVEFFNNKNGILDSFRKMWAHVGKTLKNEKNIIGYEFINDYFEGVTFEFSHHYRDQLETHDHINETRLEHLYHYTAEEFRKIDSESILFYLPNFEHSHKHQIVEGPGGDKFSNKSAMTYTIYCQHNLGENANSMKCKGLKQVLFNQNLQQLGKKKGNAFFCGEMGALSETHEEHHAELEFMVKNVEIDFHWWAFWQYKTFGSEKDPHRHTHADSMYNSNGTVDDDKLNVLVHTYAYAVCGDPINQVYDKAARRYDLAYIANNCKNKRTEFYIDEKLYPEGFYFDLSECIDCKVIKLNNNYYAVEHSKKVDINSRMSLSVIPGKHPYHSEL